MKMKKALSLAMCLIMLVPATVHAFGNSQKLISEDTVLLTSQDSSARAISSKAFSLYTYDDNGRTVYGFDVDDPAYRAAAEKYIMELTGDSAQQTRRQRLGYQSDNAYNGDAASYAWKDGSYATIMTDEFEGGQSATWSGNEDADFIILNQDVSISGLILSVSWPPSMSADSNSSASWTSQPVYSNVAGAAFTDLEISAVSWSINFYENGDVYVGNRIYRPLTYIRYALI